MVIRYSHIHIQIFSPPLITINHHISKAYQTSDESINHYRAWNSSQKWGFSRKWKSKIVEKYFFRGKKIDRRTFFLWKLRWRICECKLEVQNWSSSWILMCKCLPVCLQNASYCTDFSLDFQNFLGGMSPDLLEISSFFISNSRLCIINYPETENES